ncbi:MAG: uncharacterized protein QOJ35_1665 [Solirubrobacteraceae bacterium]|nr:uncharacterized protein [Solirubrobacteraceae bacterium]
MATVTALATTPVKGLRVTARTELTLTAAGAPDDRRFHLVDERGWMVNGKQVGELSTIVAEYRDGTLALTFPGGEVVADMVALGPPIDTRFFSRPARARPVLGPWSDALSAYAGRPLRLVESAGRSGVDRGRAGGVSLISRASLDGLARVAGTDGVDARRFRMLVEIDGVTAHAEDEWIGAAVRIGGALVRIGGHVGRCLITSRHPESGFVDLPTLDLLRSYRGGLDTTEPLAFGVYGEVLEGGRVAVGDAVAREAAG